ncbi:MAG TPA: MerR family DNA-binding transcriptional regulator [Steroidobacteraceae bacterium]
MDTIGIGALAKRAGVRIDTVRYYERSGLLAPRARLATGYRRSCPGHGRAMDCPILKALGAEGFQ